MGAKPSEQSERQVDQPEAETEDVPVDAFVEEETSTEEYTSVEEEAPTEEETPTEDESPAEEESPVEEDTSVEEEAPTEEEAPAEEESPTEEESPVEADTPVEEETPVDEEAPIEAEPSIIEEETPTEEETPAEEESPATPSESATVPAEAQTLPATFAVPVAAPVNAATQPEAEEETAPDEPAEPAAETEPAAEAVPAIETEPSETTEPTIESEPAAPVAPAAPALEVSNAATNAAAPDGAVILLAAAPEAQRLTDAAANEAAAGDEAASDGAATEETAAPKAEDKTIALQQLIKDKIGSLTTLSGIVQIILAKNVTFEGDVEIKKSDEQTVEDGFQLELVAEDALNEKGEVIPAGGSGKTIVSGNLKISGISVLMRGVLMALGKKITVSDARLTYEGIQKTDALEVELAGNGSAQINTYGGEDNVSVTLYDGALNAEINTGDDDDKASVTAYDGTASVETGDGDDTVSLNLQSGTGVVKVDTGKGGDKVDAKIASNGGTTIKTGDGADKVEIDTQYGSDNITAETGDGDDRVSVKKSDDLYSESPSGRMKIDLGGGASRLDVDLSVAKGFATIETVADKAAGSHLHLTGKLNSDTSVVAEDKRIEWVSAAKEALLLHADGGMTLNIGVKDFYSLSDALDNKMTKKVSEVTAGNYADFVNYTLDNATDIDGVKSWSRGSAAAPNGLTLTNLVLSSDDDLKVGYVDARGFNLLIQGKNIDLTDVIKAKNIAVLAKEEHSNALIDSDSQSLLDKAQDVLDWIAHSFDQNVVKKAIINVRGTAALYATDNIDLTAQLKQSGGLLQNDLIAKIINPVNVKIGTAEVNIEDGAVLAAGYGEDGETGPSGNGSITAEAKINTESTAGKAALNLPVGVNVTVENASVTIAEGATLKAARNITVGSESKIKAEAESTSKLLPFAVSVDVILNNVLTNVKGTLTAGKDITLSALGDMTSNTTAKHDGDGKSGMYLGVNVPLQYVRTLVGSSAVLNATGGKVNVQSTANMQAATVAKSGSGAASDSSASKDSKEEDFAKEKEDSGFGKTQSLGIDMAKKLGATVWGKLSGAVVGIFKNDPTEYEKFRKMMESVAGDDYSVKLAEDSEQKGDVKFTKLQDTVGVYTDVEITPWDGHQVDKVYYVYVDNKGGEDAAVKYTVVEALDGSDPDDNIYRIPQKNANVLVYVTYKDGESRADDVDTWTPDDLFNENDDDYGQDLQDLFDNSTNGTRNSDSDEPAGGDDDASDADKLKFSIEPTDSKDDSDKTVGSILNTKFSMSTGASDTTVAKGGKVTFVANAKSGYKLKDEGLVVTYYIEGEEKEQKVVLKDDGNGRYTFTVPSGILTDKYDNGIAFKVISEFEKAEGESSNNVNQTRNQVNGSVAVTVAMNDNRAEITDGATVTAGGAVNVTASAETRADTNTDGTGVEKNPEKKEEGEKKKQEEQQKLLTGQYIVTGKEVSLTLDAVSGGTVDVKQNGAYGYTLTPMQGGSAVKGATATLRYMTGGKWKSETLTANGDGTFTVNLGDYVIDKGTQAVLGFAMPGSSSEKQEKRDLVDFPMNVSYNVFQLSKEEDPYNVGNRKIGNVYFVRTAGAGSDAKYYFDIRADWANGYTVDAEPDDFDAGNTSKNKSKTSALWASYKDGSGAEKKVALRQDEGSGYWYVLASDLAGIAQGGNVTVNVRFTEDKHGLVEDDVKHGKVTFSKSSAKATDVVTIKAAPDANYGVGKITVKYVNKNTGLNKTETLTPDENGEVKFTMPVLADGTSVHVSAEFNEKTLTLQKDAKSGDVSIKTDAKASAGQKVAVSLTEDAVKAGKKLNDVAEVTYTPKEGQRKTVQVTLKDGKITLPDDIADRTDVSIAVNAVEKAIALEGGEAKLDHGTLKIAASRADKGEKVVVTITPEAGYRFKQGSGTVEITTDTSSYKVKLTRKDDSSLTFTLPSSMTSAELTAAKVNIALKGEFEKGNPDSSSYETSFGAAASVAVVNSKNNAVISGGTISGGSVSVNAVTVGESKASASAGYSKAVTGLAGGFGVQVASFDTNALVKKSATITTSGLTVSAKGTHGLETTGSAAGAKDAGTTGVGSGIAVNVSSADVNAAVQDSATVTAKDGNVTISAENKTTDNVTAKAGAKAETGITPVVGVDVFGSSATAYLGRLSGGALTAKTVAVTAENTAAHNMTADASTGGGGVALGGAFAVTVIHDEALARLNKSVTNTAGDSAVTVTATANATQSVTATAGVTGGVKGTAGKDGSAGSADKQVDSILGGAGNIAASNKSKSLSMKGSGSSDRQKAQTSEGSIGGAAAVAVNVLSNSAVARVMNGTVINIGGAMAVKSVNRTETKLKANGSTAKTDTGVGVAVAVNIVNIENIAEIGTGAVTAGSLIVSALMPEKADNAADEMTTVKMPESRDAMIAQLATYIKDGINSALSEMGVDQTAIGELAAEFSETFIEYVLKETGLSELLGDGTFEEKRDKVMKDLNDLWDSVKEYPNVLLEPLKTLKDEIVALKDIDLDNLKAILLDELKTQLPNLLKSTVMAVLNRAKDDLGSLALGAVNDKIKGKDMSGIKEKAKETLKNAIKAEWTTFSNQLLNDALTRLRSEVPVLTQQNVDRIKSVFTTSLAQKKDSFINYFTDSFQSKVFNYSAVMDKIVNTDFKSKAKQIMLGALNTSLSKLGNKSIEKLVNNLDVQLVPEDVSDKHVIRTEAIAGAAAKDVGIAGSVAIAVVNANTSAVVNSGSGMRVTGDAVVDAREARRVTTVASAALDEKGNADKNKNAGKKEEKDTAGGDAMPTVHLGEQLEVKSAAGATLAQDAADKDIVWIAARDGWKITAGADKAVWTYTDDKGKEKTGKIEVYSKEVDGETKYYVKASDATTATGKLTTITVTPEEDLRTISGLDTINLSDDDATKGPVPNGAVTVSVEGRDEAVKDGKLSAKVTDTVKIAVNKTKLNGLAVDAISYITADGKIHEVPLSSTENGEEIVFTFTMPAQNVTGILVEVDTPNENNTNTNKTAATDSDGHSVGVGASFAMVYGDSSVTAAINRNVTMGALTVNAESDHAESTSSVSGTDALTGDLNVDATKKTAVDASIALDILDNEINATLGGTVKTTKGDLILTAAENAISETRASGYAVGSATAVGAAVAVNIANSDVNVQAKKDLTSAGSAKISANSHSEDVTRALATAMGADIARTMNKVGESTDKVAEKSNDLLQGKLFDGKTDGGDNKKNDTADKINARMDKKKSQDGENSSKNLSLSSNVLRNQNVTTEDESAGGEGTNEALTQIQENTGTTLGGSGEKTKSKVQVAAAVGVTVASHDASVEVGKVTASGAISATAENTGNFNTMGTGAAMSLAKKANSIAFGVAVSVNNNKAKVTGSGDLNATNGGDVTLTSKLTQNMDGEFRGKLAAQSLAGSVSGAESSVSLAGAVSVLVSHAESSVDIADGKSNAHRIIKGGNVAIEATDKSKLTARAGGISLSKGSSVGMGIASANVITGNTVTAKVGNYADITAGSFKLNAEKQAVTDADYKSNIDMRYLITDSSKLTDEQRKEAKTGLIDVHKGKDEDNYTVDVNLSSDKLLDAMDGLNFLSAQNTYVEAIAGSVMFGGEMSKKNKASLAGSFAVAVSSNKVEASLGNNANVTLTKGENRDGSMTVNADNGTTTRIIAGSLSAAPAKAAVGVTVAVLVDSDKATASTGRSSKITADGDFTQTATTGGDIQLFTGAMSVAVGTTNEANAAGGAVNVIVTKNITENNIGYGVNVTSGGSAKIASETALDLMAISGSANVSASTKSAVAAGGTVNAIVDKSTSSTVLGGSNGILAAKDLSVTSDVSDQLISGTMSASVAASTSGKSGAGVVNVIVSKSAADTTVILSSNLEATQGDLKVTANNDAWMLNAGLAAAGSGGKALGGAFNVNVFNRSANVNMATGTLTAGNNVITQASGRDTDIMAGLSMAGGVSGTAVSGNVIVAVMNSKIKNTISRGMTVNAGNSAVMEAYYSGFDVAGAGNVAVSGSSDAAGVAIVTFIRSNEVRAELGQSTVTAKGGAAVPTLSGKQVSGVYVGANASEQQYVVAAGVAASGGKSLNGTVAVLVNSNKVIANASQTTLKAEAGNIGVEANDDTHQLLLAGGLNASGGMGGGAAVTTLVSNKQIEAVALNMDAHGDVGVKATNSDDIIQLAISAGISGGGAIQIGAAVQVLKSRAVAHVGTIEDDGATKTVTSGTVNARNGAFSLDAKNDTTLRNIGAAVGFSGGNAVTPVGVVTYFQGEADARLREKTSVTAAKDVSVRATGNKNLSMVSVGAAAGSMGISGTVNVLVSKDKTKAIAETGTKLTAGASETAASADSGAGSTAVLATEAPAGSIAIEADSEYKLRTVSAAIAAGSVGTAVNAVVSVLKSNVTAELGGIANAAGDVAVKANSTRDVVDVVGTAGVGGSGFGVTAMVLVAGTKMSQDAADMVAYGNADSKSKENATFDAETFMSNIEANGAASKYYNDENETDADRKLSGAILAQDIAGNGHHESANSVGTKTVTGEGEDKQSAGTFDGNSGYRSDDFSNSSYDDDGEQQRGENLEAKDTEDVAKAKNLNTYTYDDEPSDQVVARITTTGAVEKAEGVSVTADQKVSADLYGATLAAGSIGAGVSAAVAVLHSNVTASSVGNIRNVGSEGINISANSHSGDVAQEADTADRDNALKNVLKDLDPSKRAIRAVGVSVGAGSVGVAVGVSVVLTDNVTQAILGGKVDTDGDTNVTATHDYGNVLAATAALSAGGVAAGASVAVAQANGTVKAELVKGDGTNAGDEGIKIETRNLNIKTDTNVNVNALAATAGAGGVSLNGGVGLAFNRLEQSAGIRKGAVVNVTGDLTMTSTSRTTADSSLLGMSFGGVGGALNAAVSDLDAKIDTAIENSTVNVGGKLTVKNDVFSSATPKVLSVAAGAVGISGNVLLAFNESKATARIDNSNVTAGNLDVISDLGSKAESSLASLAAGEIAVGVSVNYVDLSADNRAAVRGGTVKVNGDMSVRTGVGASSGTEADAQTIGGSLGLVAVGLNTAIARNNTKNYAILTDIDKLTVDKTLTVHANGSASTDARLMGLNIGAINAAASVVVSLNDADNRTVVSVNNAEVGGMSTFNATQDATTYAGIMTGGGSLIGLTVNAAVAYGRAASVVDVTLNNSTGLHGITAHNTAGDAVDASIGNQSLDFLAAQAMIGAAYSQDVFDTRIKLNGDNTVNGDVDIRTTYLTSGNADITPSEGGVDVSLAKVAVNAALAKNTAYAGAALESTGGTSTISGDVNVFTDGSASTNATVRSAELKVSAVSLGANVAKSSVSATQAARIALDNSTLHITGDADIQSLANNANRIRWTLKAWKAAGEASLKDVDVDNLSGDALKKEYVAQMKRILKALKASGNMVLAKVDIDKLSSSAVESYYTTLGGSDVNNALYSSAFLGTSSGEGIDVSLVNVQVNIAHAKENMESTAAVTGKSPEDSILNVDGGMNMFAGVKEGVKTGSLSRTDGAMAISLASIGILDGQASSNDSFNVALSDVNMTVGGAADLKVRTDTTAYGHGTSAGGFKLAELDISNITAGVGTKKDKETAKIVLGKGVKLTADTINMEALNQGATEATYKKGTTISALDVCVSKQPTTSYYDTGVSIGKDAVVTAKRDVTSKDKYALNIATETKAQAKSEVSAKQIAMGFNVEVMEGTNYIYDDNIISIGKGATLDSVGSMNIQTLNNTSARATTDLMGIGALFSGTFSGATNSIDRVGRITIKDGATLKTRNGSMNLSTVSGTADDIYTYSNADSGGLIALGTATAKTKLESENAIIIGENVNLSSAKDMNLFARSTSHKASGAAGVENTSIVDVGGLGVNIDSKAQMDLLFTTAIYINKGGKELTQLQTNNDGSNISARVDNAGLKAYNKATGSGGGAGGFATADARIQAKLQNNIWVDTANLYSEGKVTLLATNSPDDAGKPFFKVTANASMQALVGKVTSNAVVEGDAHNQIRTNSTDAVSTKGEFIHIAVDPKDSIQDPELKATYNRLAKTTSAVVDETIYWESMKRRCDFCADGQDVTPDPLKADRGTDEESAMEKALKPISDIARMVSGLGDITKARYGDEDDLPAGEIYVLDVETPLKKDVTFGEDRLKKYRLWTNVQTQHDVMLLPNATRLYRAMKLDYVSEVLRGDVRGDGGSYTIDIFTALNANAFRHPVIPIGSTGKLDFSTGTFTLPELSDFELYLHEVSGAWLLEQLNAGIFRRLGADQANINTYVLENESTLEQTLPTGPIVEGLTEDGETDGWRKFWLGDTPETAESDSQVLVYLLWNETTDEVDAFRTSRAMIEAGEADIDVSLYIFRDSKADRMGEEKYDILFFDTPEGKKSLVKLITDVLESRALEVPKVIRIVLRSFDIEGADLPAYSLNDHFFAMCDGTDGKVSMFDGFYNATFDGDTFDSDYTRIEGILKNDLTVTLKKGQTIWPEHTGKDSAEDIQGEGFVRVDGEWYKADEAPETELPDDAVAA